MTPEGYKKECQLYEYFFTLCINHTPISATAQNSKLIYVQVKIQQLCQETSKKLKILPAKPPTVSSNTSTAFPASLLGASASLFNHFQKVPPCFLQDDPESGGLPPRPPLNTPVTASTTVEMFVEKTVSVDTIVISWSGNKV